uniref:Transmembrane p24 trafficking protein 1b n=1 Tax=Oryzias latipes TaxID=8090 RepID=A0A3P9LA54_ORYLA
MFIFITFSLCEIDDVIFTVIFVFKSRERGGRIAFKIQDVRWSCTTGFFSSEGVERERGVASVLTFLLWSFQVIAGAGMDVDFTIVSPEGVRLIVEARRSDGVHVVEPTEGGDYQICFDNSFSRFSEKMVFFEILTEAPGGDAGGDEEWPMLDEPDGSLLEYKLEDIRDSMDAVYRRLDRSRQMQTVLRAFEARDRNLLEDNLWRVSFWSCASVVVMLCVALTQVYTVSSTGGGTGVDTVVVLMSPMMRRASLRAWYILSISSRLWACSADSSIRLPWSPAEYR